MASIYKLPSGSWRVQIRQNGQAISKAFSLKADARSWAKSMEGNQDEIDAFPNAEARKRTVAQAINAYMLDYSGRDTAIVKRLSWWTEHFGGVSLAAFNQTTIKDGLRQLGREKAKRHAGKKGAQSLGRSKAPATINRYLQAISSVLTWAVDQDWITKNPARGMKRQKEPRGRVRWLDDSERTALLAACDESGWPDLGLLVRLALSTGARRGELLNLRWSDIDLKKGLAYVGKTKNDEPRILPLITPVRLALQNKPRPIKGGPVFASPRDKNKPFYGFRKHWEAAVTKAKLENFHFHDLRHTAASYLAMSGASPLEIGDILGHKTLAMVHRYSHLATEHKAKLTERVFGGLV